MATNLNLIRLTGIYFIFAMHIYIANNGGNGFSLPANIVGTAFLAMMIIIVQWRTRTVPTLSVSRALPYLCVGVCLLILPVVWSDTPWRQAAHLRLLGVIAGVGFYFSLLQCRFSRRDKIHILAILLLATAVEALLGLGQYFFFAADNFMGYPTQPNRPYGIFQQVNVMASFMASGLAIALYLWQQKSVSRRVRILAGAMLFLAPWLLVLIGSRIGLLAAAVITPLQLLPLYLNNRRACFYALGLMAAGMAAAVLSLTAVAGGRALEQFADTHIRLTGWKIALELFAMRPFTGWGYGHFYAEFVQLLHLRYPALSESYHLQHPHNEILLWGVEGGLIALAGMAVGMVGFIRSMLVGLRVTSPGAWLRFLSSPWLLALPILLHMMVELPLYQSAAHGMMLILLLRIGEKNKKRAIGVNLTPYRLTVGGLALLLLVYMFCGFQVSHRLIRLERQGLTDLKAIDNIRLPNPLQSRLDWDRHLARLLHYSDTQDPTLLHDYQRWAQQYVRVKPDAGVYRNLMLIARLQGDENAFRYWQGKGLFLYPEDERFIQ